MRKFFTVIAAVLFAGSMMAATTMTCADAATAALSVSADNELYNNGEEIEVTGYVTSIQTAFNAQYSNVSFWMDDTKGGSNVIEAYRAACASAADAPSIGDKVKVTGKLTKYGTTPEFAAGCTFVIEERDTYVPQNLGYKTIAEFLQIKSVKDTCILRGAIANIVMDKDDATLYNKYGNFDLVDATGSLYIYGLLTPEGEAQQFREMGLNEGDSITIKAIYTEYQGNPQAKNAILVEGGSVVPVEEADVIFVPADFEGQGQAATQETPGGAVSTTKDNVTVSTDNGYGHSLALRVYKGGRFAITSSEQQIGKVVFKFYSTYNGGLDNEVVVNDNEFVVESMASQARIEKISIFFGEYEKPEVDTLTAAEALAAAQALEVGATQKVVCMAYIANIKTPYSEEFGNITVWLNDDPTSTYGDIQAYRAKCSAEDGAAIAEHDLVLIEGNVTHTQNQDASKDYYEFASGAQLKLLEKAQGIENIELTEKVQKVVVDGVIYIIRDNKMFNVQGTQVR